MFQDRREDCYPLKYSPSTSQWEVLGKPPTAHSTLNTPKSHSCFWGPPNIGMCLDGCKPIASQRDSDHSRVSTLLISYCYKLCYPTMGLLLSCFSLVRVQTVLSAEHAILHPTDLVMQMRLVRDGRQGQAVPGKKCGPCYVCTQECA